jgi:hypothetical protein
MSFSPQNLGPDQYQECARVLSIILFKFDFPLKMFYSATPIIKAYEKLTGISTSFFRCNDDDLKLALANWPIRRSVKKYFKGRIEYQRSTTDNDVIFEGDLKFLDGYQIKFSNDGIFRSKDVRDDITSLIEHIMKDVTAGVGLSLINLKRPVSNVSESETAEEDETDYDHDESSFEMEVDDDENKKRKGRPKLNNTDREVDLSYELKKRKMVITYNKEKKNSKMSDSSFNTDQSDEAITIRNKSLALVSLVKDSGVYFKKVNDTENSLSIVTGLFVQNMYSEGISQQKLPIVMGLVLTTLFGKIDDFAYSALIKSSSTYMNASERVQLLMKTEVKDKFLVRNNSRYEAAHLMIDASNKKGKACVGKILMVIGTDGIVKQSALKLDTSITKKAEGSADLTTHSMQEEIGDGAAFIMSVGTDGFGAATKEGISVLKGCDDIAVEIKARVFDVNNPQRLTAVDLIRASPILGQSYDYGGRFREERLIRCLTA